VPVGSGTLPEDGALTAIGPTRPGVGQICLAVGYRTIAGVRRTLAERWNGTAWKILATPPVS
jgi:hypothetical protein